MGRLKRSRKAGERDTYHHVKRLETKWRKKRAKAIKAGEPLPPLDPTGIEGLKKSDKSPAARFWRERGGTPAAIPPALAPVPVSPPMRLWLRIDEELIGGLDDSGCYPTPDALERVLGWYEEPIRVWLEEFAGFGPGQSDLEAMRTARSLVRCIGSGRAEVIAEEFSGDDDSDDSDQG